MNTTGKAKVGLLFFIFKKININLYRGITGFWILISNIFMYEHILNLVLVHVLGGTS
eukprot:SAG11_NODE_5864_length_1445_cov_1.860327_1_plen_57_part_00